MSLHTSNPGLAEEQARMRARPPCKRKRVRMKLSDEERNAEEAA